MPTRSLSQLARASCGRGEARAMPRHAIRANARTNYIIAIWRRVLMIPLFTEKSARILENNQYTFDVDPKLTKPEIRELLEKTFQVKVISLNTHRPPRKKRRLGQFIGSRPQIKRVIFTLRPEDSIPLFE
jgi:large subunit ribosomal protein L23